MLTMEQGRARYSKAGSVVPKYWCGRDALFPLDRTVIELVSEQTRKAPHAPAVEAFGRKLSYADLDTASNAVAAELHRRGLKLEEPVAVLLAPSCDYIVALFGVLKAGGCYLPIEQETPVKRIEFMLADSACRFLLTDEAGGATLRGWAGTKLKIRAVCSRKPSGVLPCIQCDSKRRIYIAYTSGSSGQPKGVEIEHRAVTNLVWNYIEQLQLTSRDRASLLAHLAFDVSVADIWPVLCAGGTLVIPPSGVRHEPNELMAWLHSQAVTLSFIPTGLAELLLSRPWPQRMALRYLTTGGDRLRARPPAGLPFLVINGYGPTECTVFGTWSLVTPVSPGQSAPPIGRPLANLRAYVLDEQRQPLPVGSPGELYLSGVQVGRGYLGREMLTDEVFLADPFQPQTGTNSPWRMYRTGDWARWREDGELEFLGRQDSQIKVRGFRVELGEIEALLFKHPAVQRVACVPLLDEGMPMGAVAHIVSAAPGTDLAPSLRPYLLEHLPALMVPMKFVEHPRLPLTPQGKVDRAALIALGTAPEQPAAAAASGELATQLAQIWNSFFPNARTARPQATFAELGGDSLLAMKLLLRIEELTGRYLKYTAFLQQATFTGMLAALRRSTPESSSQPVIVLRNEGARPPLFCLFNAAGNVDIYTHLTEALGPDQPVYGIRFINQNDRDNRPASLEAAVAEAMGHIRKIQPHGAPALIGYSWAGLLGFELARQYYEATGQSCFCAMIGTSAPERQRGFAFRVRHFFTALPALLAELCTPPREHNRRISIWWKIRRRLSLNGAKVRAFLGLSKPVPAPNITALERHMIALGNQYQPTPGCRLPISIFRERGDYSPRRLPFNPGNTDYLPDFGWSYWTNGAVELNWVDGDHESVLRYPDVLPLAQSIRRSFERYLSESAEFAVIIASPAAQTPASGTAALEKFPT